MRKSNLKTVRETSSFPYRCLLFAKSFSGVPVYADENDFVKYICVFRHLPQRVDFIDTLTGLPEGSPVLHNKKRTEIQYAFYGAT